MTTDEMDKITPSERADLVGICKICGDWKRSTANIPIVQNCKCPEPYSIDQATIQTYRTFDYERSKKASAKYKKDHNIK